MINFNSIMYLRIGIFFLFTHIFAIVGSAWMVKHASEGGPRLSQNQSDFVLMVANSPVVIRDSFSQLIATMDHKPKGLIFERFKVEKPWWKRDFPSKADDGYLLFSGLDKKYDKSTVSLIRIADGAVLANWIPDWKLIFDKSKTNKFVVGGGIPALGQAVSPFIFSDGSIVFNTGASMVKMNLCTAVPAWVLNEVAHHSNDIDNEGNIWTSGYAESGFGGNEWLQKNVKDDAILKVSTDGVLLEKISFVDILIKNGLKHFVVGTKANNLNADPLHLNQISVAKFTTKYWDAGDLLISARHAHTIFLYRPSTKKIVWYKTGPWTYQHSVAFIDDHRISIFNNNIFGGAHHKNPFLLSSDHNEVMIYDFNSGDVNEPYAKLLNEEKPITISQGRAQILNDGGMFVEETDSGRLMRFSTKGIMWSMINDYSDNEIGVLNWSKYIPKGDIDAALLSIFEKKCH